MTTEEILSLIGKIVAGAAQFVAMGTPLANILALIGGLVAQAPAYISLGKEFVELWNGKEPTPEEITAYNAALDAEMANYERDYQARLAQGV